MEIKDINGQKLELVVNHQGRNMAEVSMPRVFAAMGRRKTLFVRVLILFVVIGLMLPMYMAEKKVAATPAQAAMLLDYSRIDTKSGLKSGPDAVRFTTADFANALKKTPLPYVLSPAGVESAATVDQLLTDESLQHLDVTDKLISARSDYARIAGKEILEYEDNFIVTISNGFYDLASGKTVFLSADQMRDVLNNLISSYTERLALEKAGISAAPSDVAFAAALPGTADKLDAAADGIETLLKYCSQAAAFCPQFRTSTGISFADLADAVRVFKNTELAGARASAAAGLTDSERQAASDRYSYLAQAARRELASVNSRIEANSVTIAQYEGESVNASSSFYKEELNASVNSDAYNDLVLSQSVLIGERSDLESRLSEIERRRAALSGAQSTEGSVSPDTMIKDALKLEELVRKCAAEYSESGFASQTLMTVVPAVSYDGSLINSGNIKKAIVGAAAGAVIAAAAWFIAGFAEEIRKEGRRDEEA